MEVTMELEKIPKVIAWLIAFKHVFCFGKISPIGKFFKKART
jgi:hypothetical protein